MHNSRVAPAPILSESVWRRGWYETKRGWGHWSFLLLTLLISPTTGLLVGLVTGPSIGVIAGSGLVIVVLVSVWIRATITAPVKQRNQLRQLYEHTAAAELGAGYERYISSILNCLEQYLSQPQNGNARVNYNLGQVIVEGDDGRRMGFSIEPPGRTLIWPL